MIRQPKSIEKALSDIASFCATAERCRMEVERKLRSWGLEPGDASRILERLEKEDFLNEQRYVSAFVHDKAAFDKWGPFKIRQALLQKNLPLPLVESAIQSLEEENGFHEAEEALGRYLGKRALELLKKDQDPYRQSQSLTSSGLQRGFSPETVLRIIRSLDLPGEFSDSAD